MKTIIFFCTILLKFIVAFLRYKDNFVNFAPALPCAQEASFLGPIEPFLLPAQILGGFPMRSSSSSSKTRRRNRIWVEEKGKEEDGDNNYNGDGDGGSLSNPALSTVFLLLSTLVVIGLFLVLHLLQVCQTRKLLPIYEAVATDSC